MNTRIIIYLLSAILLCTSAMAVGVGSVVEYPGECDSGFANSILGTNDTYTLVCVDSGSIGYDSQSIDVLYDTSVVTFAEPMSQAAIDIQMELAESATVWTDADDLYWSQKFDGFEQEGVEVSGLKVYISNIWDYIWAIIVLYLEMIKLGFYLIEVVIVIYVVFTAIPNTFFKLRDSLVRSYIRRYAT